MDMSAFLPVWIIGAPLLAACVERFMTPSARRVGGAHAGNTGARTTLSAAG